MLVKAWARPHRLLRRQLEHHSAPGATVARHVSGIYSGSVKVPFAVLDYSVRALSVLFSLERVQHRLLASLAQLKYHSATAAFIWRTSLVGVV